MSNWSGQIAQHVEEKHASNVYVYHGPGRVTMKAPDFSEYDVVITTCGTLSSDYVPKGKASNNKQPERQLRSTGLNSMHWRYVRKDHTGISAGCLGLG